MRSFSPGQIVMIIKYGKRLAYISPHKAGMPELRIEV